MHGGPALAMNAGAGETDEDARLEQLRRQYPRWLIWRGGSTGEYWAMPPRGHPTQRELIAARNLDELAWILAESEGQHG